MSGSDFSLMLEGIVGRAHDHALEQARERGFNSIDAMLAHDDRAERERRKMELDSVGRRHREAVTAAMAGRLRPDIVASLIDGADLGETSAMRAVRAWFAGSRPVLVLSGGTGTGKTVAAAWALCQRVGTFQALRAARLGSAYERWSSDREDGVEPLRLGVSTMLVDDLGREPMEDRRVEPAVEEIFDARQTPAFRTIVTTNLAAVAMRGRYSERVISRLSQNATVINLDGTDLRRGAR